MPNTLVHLGLQTPASRLLIRDADFRWIALGCIIPDIPWIVQRIIVFAFPGTDLINLRLYAVIQASLFFCLLFSLALSLVTINPGKIFLLLAGNSFVHLLLDALQTKWANGVHLFAPFSWKMTSFFSIWPEHRAIYILSALGFVVLVAAGIACRKNRVRLTGERLNWGVAVLLLSGYFLLPFLILQGPEKENTHFSATLRHVEKRPGKYIEIDRRRFRSSDSTILVYSGERVHLLGNIPDRDGLFSIRGRFVDRKNIHVTSFHRHTAFRDLASLTGLAGIMLLWLLAILRNNIIISSKQQQ